MRALALALLACALCLGLAAPASASRDQESIFEDEHQLLELGSSAADRSLDDIDALGADTVRSLVLWSRLAPGGARRPTGFRAADPRAYPAALWDPYDGLVRGTAARGLGVILSPSTPMPAWASRCKRGDRATCKPDPTAYGAFDTALGRRYSGAYRDENQGGGVLPRVTRWSLGNEPNQPGWLTPQYERKRGRLVATAAVVYRQLAQAGTRAPRGRGRGGDQSRLGEPSPSGRTRGSRARRPVPPLQFLQKLFCLNARGGRLSGADGRAHGCGKFKKLAVRGFAHHPYQRGGSPPPAQPPPGPREITISAPARPHPVPHQARRAPRGRPRAAARSRSRRRRACTGCSTRPAARGGSPGGCRSTTRSTASRPTRRIASSASAPSSSPPTSTSPTGWRTGTRACGAWRSTSWSTRRRCRASSRACAS